MSHSQKRTTLKTRNRADHGKPTVSYEDPAVLENPEDGHLAEYDFTQERNDDMVAEQPNFKVVKAEHPIFEATPEWIQAMKEFVSANLVVPLIALVVVGITSWFVFTGHIPSDNFMKVMGMVFTAVVIDQKSKKK